MLMRNAIKVALHAQFVNVLGTFLVRNNEKEDTLNSLSRVFTAAMLEAQNN